MRQVMGNVLGIGKIVILNDDVSAACGIKDGSGKASFARKPLRHLPAWGRATPLRITAAFLAATWASQTQGFLEPLHAQADPLVSARDVTAARIPDVGGAAGDGEVEAVKANRGGDKSVQLAQTATDDTQELRQALEQESHKTEMLAGEVAGAQRGLELLLTQLNRARDESARIKQAVESEAAELRKALQPERDPAGRLKQQSDSGADELRRSLLRYQAEGLERDLGTPSRDVEPRRSPQAGAGDDVTPQDLAARRDVETQTALAAKANGEAARLKQVADNGSAELNRSLQQEHDRAEALAQDLSMARAKIYAYEAQAATDRKQASESGTVELRKSLQQESDRAGRLEQDLAAARRDVETQTALAAKANGEAARLKQVAESDSASLRRLLQEERHRAAQLEQDLAFERSTKDVPAAAGVVAAGRITLDSRREAGATKPVAADQTRRTARNEHTTNRVVVGDKPAAVEGKFAAKQSETVAPENSQPANNPVETALLAKSIEHEPHEHAISPNYCIHYRTYDPASGTYRSYDGRIRPCR